MSYIPAGQVHSDAEFDALFEAKGKALREAAAAQGVSLSQVRLTDEQNKAVNRKARAAFKKKSQRLHRPGTGGPQSQAQEGNGKDNTMLYVGYVGAAAVVALLLFGKKR
jgi:hypothetical protein